MNSTNNETDFSEAVARAAGVRGLYHELEKRKHWAVWTTGEDVIGFVSDVG